MAIYLDFIKFDHIINEETSFLQLNQSHFGLSGKIIVLVRESTFESAGLPNVLVKYCRSSYVYLDYQNKRPSTELYLEDLVLAL